MSTPPPDPRPPRLDDPADNAPLPRPVWIATTVEKAQRLGVCRTQREVMAELLGELEFDDLPVPEVLWASSKFVVWWGYGDRSVQAEMRCSSMGWQARVSMFRGEHPIVDETPRHPANLLRTMLATVFPPEGR